MAKRKAARRGRPAPGPAKRVRRPAVARKARPRTASKARSKKPSRPTARKSAGRAKPSRPRASSTKRASSNARQARTKATKPAPAKRRVAAKPAPKAVARKTTSRPAVKVTARRKPAAAPVRKLLTPELAKRKHVLDLGRDRRRVQDDDDVVSPTPPSSLGLDRSASAARSGRQELRERYDKHTETSPALTGGDVDADWESAYSVGDEAPGGDNPTPDQSVVDDIGAAVGLEYDDNEELEGADRIEERDRHRWEYDPASSDDFDER